MDGRKEEGRKGLDPQLETYGKVLQHKAEVTVVEMIFKHRTTAFDDKTWDELARCNIDCTGCSVSCTLIGCFFDGDVVPRDYIKELCLAHPEVRSDDCPRPSLDGANVGIKGDSYRLRSRRKPEEQVSTQASKKDRQL